MAAKDKPVQKGGTEDGEIDYGALRATLDDINRQIADQGQVVDDRLLEKKRRTERLLENKVPGGD